MVPMLCKTDHNYGGIDRHPGDEFQVEDEHVIVEELMGRAERIKITVVAGVASALAASAIAHDAAMPRRQSGGKRRSV